VTRGLWYMVASALGFSAMSVLVKIASKALPTGEIVLARAIVTLVISALMVARAGISPWGKRPLRLVGRGLLGFSALACYYLSLGRLDLADATTLQNTTPLITAVLGWWLLDERVGRAAAIALAFGLAGVVLVVSPGFTGTADLLGLLIAAGGAAFSAVAYVTVRKLAATEHALAIVLYFPLVATPLAAPWAAYHFVWPSPRDWVVLVAIGATTQVGQVFLTLGLASEKVGRATAVSYLQVCFAMVWQLVVFSQVPARETVAGAALIVAGTLVVARAGAAKS
jgi:drug/metabolite transporter (DMT)-like permease